MTVLFERVRETFQAAKLQGKSPQGAFVLTELLLSQEVFEAALPGLKSLKVVGPLSAALISLCEGDFFTAKPDTLKMPIAVMPALKDIYRKWAEMIEYLHQQWETLPDSDIRTPKTQDMVIELKPKIQRLRDAMDAIDSSADHVHVNCILFIQMRKFCLDFFVLLLGRDQADPILQDFAQITEYLRVCQEFEKDSQSLSFLSN